MDTYVSGAIAVNNPTWLLDNYIGDPRQQYSASYPDLDAQRTLYFETGVPGFAPFTASALDYNGFIRLIEYFDNSLFKMLEDFVPERASLSTGVTITSPVLERNKVVYSSPNAYTQSVYDADYEPVGISAQYGEFYDALQGNKMPFFTGELSGSTVDINQYFEDDFNPYDGNWDVWNAQHNTNQSINLNTFLHSDWNVLLNNVSQSVISSLRRDIQYFYGTTGSILTPAELQDSYLTLTSHVNSRYDGCKVTSYTYNTYTTSSSIWPGDDSYGKTPAIDLNTYKVAWVKNIPSQSLNFYDKTSISLKYLADANSNLTELSKGNLNLPEVQRTFQSGDPVILSISDVKVPSNQTTLDGTKTIWKGGFSYDPILFRENNETLYFQFDSPLSSSIGYLGVKAYSAGSFSYQASSQYAINLASPDRAANGTSGIPNPGYLYKINGDANAGLGKRMAYQKYDVNSYPYSLNSSNKINKVIPAPPPFTFYNYYEVMIFNPSFSPSYYNNPYALSAYIFDILDFSNTGSRGYNTEPDFNTYTELSDGNFYYRVPRGGNNYTIKLSIPFSFKGRLNGRFPLNSNNNSPYNSWTGAVALKIVGVVERCLAANVSNYQNDNVWNVIPNGFTSINPTTSTFPNGMTYQLYPNHNFLWFKGNMPDFARLYCDLNLTGVTLSNGDLLRVRFYLIDANNALGGGFPANPTTTNGILSDFTYFFGNATEFTNSRNLDSYFEIFDNNTPITNYFYTSSYGQVPPLFVTSSTNTLVFDSSSLYLFTTSSTFIPTTNTQTYYSPVVDRFGVQKYDLIRIGNFDSPSATYYEVINVSSSATNIYVTLNQNVVTSSYNNAQSFAILRPKPDETSVIIDYKKQPGEVSQTILIPFDASNTIKDAVGNIFKTLNPDLQ
jgi:hypothetical protein